MTADRQGVLIAGGGFAALEAALALGALTHGRVPVRVLSPSNMFTFVPASVVEPFRQTPWAQVPLTALAKVGGFTLVKGMLGVVETEEGVVLTTDGRRLPYDALIVAVGARRRPWLRGAEIAFRGPEDVRAYRNLVDALVQLAAGGARPRLALVVPSGPTWSLPAYELALLTRAHLDRVGAANRVTVVLVTAEERPLGIFGTTASEAVTAQLAAAGVELHAGVAARSLVAGRLSLTHGAEIEVDRVVTLAAVTGPQVGGLPATPLGFVPVEQDGRVTGTEGILAAGDATDFPVKQGGVACQLADTAAATAAIMLGEPVDPIPFAPRLRGQLWSGADARFIRSDLAGGQDESEGVVSVRDPLWWPPGKVAGRYLAPALEGERFTHTLTDLSVGAAP